MLADQLQYLLMELAKHMRRLCQTLDPLDRAAQQCAALFGGLREEFDLGVYNLNYDTAALSACPDAYTGFNDNGEFEAAAVHIGRNGGSSITCMEACIIPLRANSGTRSVGTRTFQENFSMVIKDQPATSDPRTTRLYDRREEKISRHIVERNSV
jgi:ABC-type transporter Mla subunit MlaD